MSKYEEHKKFKRWYNEYGYHYKPKTDEEADWLNVVSYWAWKAWEARSEE
jgi:hypothetical protein